MIHVKGKGLKALSAVVWQDDIFLSCHDDWVEAESSPVSVDLWSNL